MHDPTNNPWKITSEKEVYDNPWINLTEYQVINPSGNPGIYGKIHYKNIGIGIIPLDEDMNTYLVGQYRFTINQYTWEIPEGGGPLELSRWNRPNANYWKKSALKLPNGLKYSGCTCRTR